MSTHIPQRGLSELFENYEYIGFIPNIYSVDFGHISNHVRGYGDSYAASILLIGAKSTSISERHIFATSRNNYKDTTRIKGIKAGDFRIILYAVRAPGDSFIKGKILLIHNEGKVEEREAKIVNGIAELEHLSPLNKVQTLQLNAESNLYDEIKNKVNEVSDRVKDFCENQPPFLIKNSDKKDKNESIFNMWTYDFAVEKSGFFFLKESTERKGDHNGDDDMNVPHAKVSRPKRMMYYAVAELFHKHNTHHPTADEWMGLSQKSFLEEKYKKIPKPSDAKSAAVSDTLKFNTEELFEHIVGRPIKKIYRKKNKKRLGVNSWQVFGNYMLTVLNSFRKADLIGNDFYAAESTRLNNIFSALEQKTSTKSQKALEFVPAGILLVASLAALMTSWNFTKMHGYLSSITEMTNGHPGINTVQILIFSVFAFSLFFIGRKLFFSERRASFLALDVRHRLLQMTVGLERGLKFNAISRERSKKGSKAQKAYSALEWVKDNFLGRPIHWVFLHSYFFTFRQLSYLAVNPFNNIDPVTLRMKRNWPVIFILLLLIVFFSYSLYWVWTSF